MELTETEGGKSNTRTVLGNPLALVSKSGSVLGHSANECHRNPHSASPFPLGKCSNIRRKDSHYCTLCRPSWSIHFSTFIIITWRPANVVAEPNIAANIARNSSISAEQFVRSWNKGLPYMEIRQSPGNET